MIVRRIIRVIRNIILIGIVLVAVVAMSNNIAVEIGLRMGFKPLTINESWMRWINAGAEFTVGMVALYAVFEPMNKYVRKKHAL